MYLYREGSDCQASMQLKSSKIGLILGLGFGHICIISLILMYLQKPWQNIFANLANL